MRITKLDIEGFGVWSGLRVERLSETINVFYGPNEAGKTTLLQFIRSMLYGFSPQRQRYLPPVHGGRPGGVLDVVGAHGRFQISRYESTEDDGDGEQLTLTAPDGTRQGEHFIKVLLSNVDEAVFNNVFAVGLSEIQELNTLSDTEAAELLYSITAGLDRVSLVEVLRELQASRNRILDVDGGPCQIAQFLGEREKLRAEIEELSTVNSRFSQLAAQREQLAREIAQLEEDETALERSSRIIDLAAALRERWTQRAALDEQLAAMGSAKVVPERAVERLDAIHARLLAQQQRISRLAHRRTELKKEFAGLRVNESLWRQAARIEAFREQAPWITQLQGQIGELEKETAGLESELATASERSGIEGRVLEQLSAKRLATLREPGKRLGESRQRARESEQGALEARRVAESLAQQMDDALKARGQPDLATAMDRAGNLVSQIRRRMQIDERLDQLVRHQAELEERCRRLTDRQMLPMGVLAGLGSAFVLGVVLILAGLFLPTTVTGSIGWALAFLGLAGTGGAALAKVMLERSNSQQLEACQKQLTVLQSQIEQTKEDRDTLDGQLPRGGSLASRLQTAEGELAALEDLAPVDAKRRTAAQEAEAAAREASQAGQEYKQARRQWRDALTTVGLPEGLSPKQVGEVARTIDRVADTGRRLAQRKGELEQRRRELESLGARLGQLAAEAEVALKSTGMLEQLRELVECTEKQAAAVARRDAIRRDASRLRALRAKREETVSRLKHRRRKLLLEAGVKDEQELRQRAEERARVDSLRGQREALHRDIQTALASQCSEEAIRQELEREQSVTLEIRRAQLEQRLATIHEQLRTMLEKRGRLSEQIDAILADRRLAERQLDLTVLNKRLEDALRRWQVLATTCSILDTIRDTYERHRQPETLQEASTYLERLTRGRYTRVWTPLGEHALRVDDAEGHALPVEVLSRGTREQLFLSLRLALASSYARRGSPLPLILDDVLVNFDAGRARAAAEVLRDFAAAGHQMLVFTCHEHIETLFRSLRAPVSQLPSNGDGRRAVIRFELPADESPGKEKPRSKEKEPRPAKRRTAAKAKKVAAEAEIAFEPSSEEPEELVPIKVAKPAKRKSRGKKVRAAEAAFDVDFFDPQDAEADEEEDFEALMNEEPEEDDEVEDESELEDVAGEEGEEDDEVGDEEVEDFGEQEEEESLWDEPDDESIDELDDDVALK